MTTAIQRSPFTDRLIAHLEATVSLPIGDGRIPVGGNWHGPVAVAGSTFVPYAVVSEILAGHSSGPLANTQADWQLPYLVESFGIIRDQTSKVADRIRQQLKAMRAETFTIDGDTYGVQQVRFDSLGAPVRVEQVSPPIWHSQDGITLWIGKQGI